MQSATPRQSPEDLYRLLKKNFRGIPSDFEICSIMKPTAGTGARPFLSFRDLWERDRRTGEESRGHSP
jgi:hypothetical protein